MRGLAKIIVALAISGVCSAGHAGTHGELSLGSVLTHELNKVLDAGDSLRAAMVMRDEEQVEIGLRDLLLQLDRTRSFASLAKPHVRSHLVRILDAARDQFEQTHSAMGEQRRSRFISGFNQLANLVRIYRLDRAYSIFFCPVDKTNWVQKGSKALNPFRSPASAKEPCGIKIPR
jgi:hypothetical protein